MYGSRQVLGDRDHAEANNRSDHFQARACGLIIDGSHLLTSATVPAWFRRSTALLQRFHYSAKMMRHCMSNQVGASALPAWSHLMVAGKGRARQEEQEKSDRNPNNPMKREAREGGHAASSPGFQNFRRH